MKNKYGLVVITADEPYDGLRHTQIMYADYISRFVPVLFVEAPRPWNAFKLLKFFKLPCEQKENLFTVQHLNVLPALNVFFRNINEKINSLRLRRICAQKKVNEILVWHFDSYRSVFDITSPRLYAEHIYHVIDPFFRNPVNEVLCRISKKIIVTSPRNNGFYKQYESKLLNVPQCIDLSHESGFLEQNTMVPLPAEKFLVLLGTISDDLDFDLLMRVAKISPLLIVGKVLKLETGKDKFEQLMKIQGVQNLGLLKPAEFYPLIKHASAGLIAYDTKIRSGNFSPLKAINYLVAGIPVISNCEVEIESLKNICVFESQNSEEFLNLCEHASTGKLRCKEDAREGWLKTISIAEAIKKITADLDFVI